MNVSWESFASFIFSSRRPDVSLPLNARNSRYGIVIQDVVWNTTYVVIFIPDSSLSFLKIYLIYTRFLSFTEILNILSLEEQVITKHYFNNEIFAN